MYKCRAKRYSDSIVIFHFPIVCWGFEEQPKCKYLDQCLKDYEKIYFEKGGSKRKWNNLLKKAKQSK